MIFCPDCAASRICCGQWRMFNPACLFCGARLIQSIGKLGRTAAEITQRRRTVLADWMAQGHSEQQLRQVAASKSPALAPEPTTTKERKK